MQEIWKDIKDYEGLYQVSNFGNVRSLYRIENYSKYKRKRNGKILRQNTTRAYNYVILCKNNKTKTFRTHRLVAETFLPNSNNYPVINHIDGNKQNNRIENLEWCTYKYNIEEAYRLGLSKTKKINQYDLKGNYIKTWNSIINASKTLKIDTSAITKCCRGKRNKAGGYKWKYND